MKWLMFVHTLMLDLDLLTTPTILQVTLQINDSLQQGKQAVQ